VVNREGKAWEQWNHYAASPLCAFTVGSDYTVNNSVADLVFNLKIADYGSVGASIDIHLETMQGQYARRDKKLVLDVHEVLRHLDS
jgi:hypothetical protein